jgi:hypothetical protein
MRRRRSSKREGDDLVHEKATIWYMRRHKILTSAYLNIGFPSLQQGNNQVHISPRVHFNTIILWIIVHTRSLKVQFQYNNADAEHPRFRRSIGIVSKAAGTAKQRDSTFYFRDNAPILTNHDTRLPDTNISHASSFLNHEHQTASAVNLTLPGDLLPSAVELTTHGGTTSRSTSGIESKATCNDENCLLENVCVDRGTEKKHPIMIRLLGTKVMSMLCSST